MLRLTIKPDKNLAALQTMFKNEFPSRVTAVTGQIAFLMAQYVMKQAKLKLTSTRDADDYRAAIKLAQIRGLGKDLQAYAIYFRSKSSKLRAIDLERSVIDIRVKRGLKGVPPQVQILSDYGPWTPDTLPFMPKKSDALLVYRKVPKSVADKVAKQNKRDRRKWVGELKPLGFRYQPKDTRIKPSPTTKAVEDLVLKSLSLELGLGGVKRVAHWKPALRLLVASGMGEISRNDDLLAALFRPGNRKWKNWPQKTSIRMSPLEANAGAEYQKKLGL